MRVRAISAVTLFIENMERSCSFYSRIPGFKLVYGGSATDTFTTYEIGFGQSINDPNTFLNLELAAPIGPDSNINDIRKHFGRIIFHTEDVDKLYFYLKENQVLSTAILIEDEPRDAPWGERYFHVREPDGYQLSFAEPSKKQKTGLRKRKLA